MLGWILFSVNQSEITSEMYEIQSFLAEAEKQGIQLKILKPEQIELIVTQEDRKSILIDGKTEALPDFVLPRRGTGTSYFTIAVIRHLERLGVPCFNSSHSIDLVKDKLFTQQILAEKSLPVPKTMLVKFSVNYSLVEEKIGFPVIIKTLSGSQGKGVFLSKNKKEFSNLMQLIEAANPSANVILQEFIKDSYGRDLRVFTLGGKAIACMERVNSSDGFKANFSAGGLVKAHELTPEIEWLAIEASRSCGLDIAGVDLLFNEGHFEICEVNSSPGFKGLDQACNINTAMEIFDYIKIRLGVFPK